MLTTIKSVVIKQVLDYPTESLKILKEEGRQKGLVTFDVLEKQWKSGQCRFDKAGEGLFFAYKDSEIIGVGSIRHAPLIPPTAGIGLLQNCYILEKERKKGYGYQLYQHLVKFAAIEFGQLQINEQCPYLEQLGPVIDLMNE